ncbi:MAG TPA: alpha-amlyase, partial [Flammeovirgaceae bacterium]|nr:alpha-amlyase [Flammeovirgaceae bacterium]
YYGYHHVMGNISGNQDKPRFMAYAGGDLRFDEDSKLAGWTRPITVTRPEGYERLKMFMAFNLTIPGIPVIYYGDEIGMTGANDPDNRRMMRFTGLQPDEEDVKATVARLAALRLQNLELTYGDFHWLLVEDDVLAYARSYFGQLTVVVFNKSPHAASLLLPLPAGFTRDSFHDQLKTPVENTDGLLQVDIEADSFMIIQNH